MMNYTDPDASAFPYSGLPGLTKREYFAIQFLAGMASERVELTPRQAAQIAVRWASDLIDILNETNPDK